MPAPIRASLLLLPLLLLLAACEDVLHEGKPPSAWATALSTVEPHERLDVVRALNDRLWPYAQSAIPGLLRALEHDDAEVRLYAARCLGRIGEAARGEAAAALAQHLADEEAHVRCAVAEALGEIGDEASIDVLVEALASDDAKVRACAAAALGRFGRRAAAARTRLREALADADARARLQAAFAHARVEGDVAQAAPIIRAALETPTGSKVTREQIYVHEAAIQGLGDLGALAAPFVPALIDVVRTNRSFARDFAAASLARLGDVARDAIPLLVEGLDDPTFRQAAARALSHFGAAAAPAVPGLIALLDRPTWKEGSTVAAEALAAIGPAARAAVPALTRTIRGRDARAAEAALVALSAIGEKAEGARGAVRALLATERLPPPVRAAALRAIVLVGGRDASGVEAELLALLAGRNAGARRAAAQALEALDLRSKTVLEALGRGAASDPDAAARRAAAEAFEALRG